MLEFERPSELVFLPEAGARFPGLVGQTIVLGAVIASLIIWGTQNKLVIKEELDKNNFKIISIKKQVVLPYKLHRKINSIRFTKFSEMIFKKLKITKIVGAPLLIKAKRIK